MLNIQEKLDLVKAGEVGSMVITNTEITSMSSAEWKSFIGLLLNRIVDEKLYFQELELPDGILVKWKPIIA